MMNSSVLEMPRLNHQSTFGIVKAATPVTANSAAVGFTTAEMESFQNNDAMAGGMIAVILGLAFSVLLGLVITVSVWTITNAG
jgi:hypothetical protein